MQDRTVAGIDHIGRTAAIVAGGIIARAVIAVLGRDRAADNGAAEQSGGDARGNATLRLCGSGMETAETANAAAAPSAINVFFMASSFSWESRALSFIPAKVPYLA